MGARVLLHGSAILTKLGACGKKTSRSEQEQGQPQLQIERRRRTRERERERPGRLLLGFLSSMKSCGCCSIVRRSRLHSVANIWDIRAGRQMQKLLGHTKWIRSIRMVGDTLITGSDDWTARMWSVSRGTCDAVLACHSGPILCVEYSDSDKGIITGSTDGLLRFWENEEGGIRCVKNVTIHAASILSINAGDHWLGIGAADNSMSLFQRPQERLGALSSTGSKMTGWQLYRTPQKTVAVVRCVASDLERKRICSGGRNGLLRLWDATINI